MKYCVEYCEVYAASIPLEFLVEFRLDGRVNVERRRILEAPLPFPALEFSVFSYATLLFH